MKKLCILLVIISAAACSKVANNKIVTRPFFSNAEQVAVIASNVLAVNSANEHFLSVERISYMQSTSYDFAFVFYKTNQAIRSFVVTKRRDTPLVNTASVTSCWGECDCRVRAILGNDGSIDVGCTCSTCKVVTGAVTFESE